MCAYGGKIGVNFCAGSTENVRCVDFHLELDWCYEYIWYLNKISVELTPPRNTKNRIAFPPGGAIINLHLQKIILTRG